MWIEILAGMLSLSTPGESPQSVVELPECGADPAQPSCTLEPPPTWSPSLRVYVRRETRAEAMVRYMAIAQAIERVAARTATPVEGGRALWPWEQRELAWGLAAIAYHESGYRRDVHSGRGPLAYGSGVDACLVQIRIGRSPDAERQGFRRHELVGVDAEATERCFTAGAQLLAQARHACARRAGAAWFAPAISLYGSGRSCRIRKPWVLARASTYEKFAARRPLPPEFRTELGLDG